MNLTDPSPAILPTRSADPQSGPLVLPDQPTGAGKGRKPTAFDHAVSLHILLQAEDDFASRHGQPGSPAYRAAWLRFRQHIKSIDDLHRVLATTSRTRAGS